MDKTIFCPCCEADRPFCREDRAQEYDVRSETVSLTLPLWVCATCRETLVDDAFGDPVEKAFEAYRQKHSLLSPDQIKRIRQQSGLSQAAFATLLGMSPATVNRYEQGSLQQKKEDELIRACDNPAHVRDILERCGHLLSPRQRRAAEAAIEAAAGSTPGQSGAWPFDEQMPEEVSARSGFRRFDFDRYAAVVIWLCQNVPTVTPTKLYKLLFYVDFLCCRTLSRSMTGVLYRQMQYGPVPVAFDHLRTRLEAEDLVRVDEQIFANGHTGEVFSPGAKSDELALPFSPEEMLVLNLVKDELGGLTPSAISERSHTETAWRQTEPRQIISYEKAQELSFAMPAARVSEG